MEIHRSPEGLCGRFTHRRHPRLAYRFNIRCSACTRFASGTIVESDHSLSLQADKDD